MREAIGFLINFLIDDKVLGISSSNSLEAGWINIIPKKDPGTSCS